MADESTPSTPALDRFKQREAELNAAGQGLETVMVIPEGGQMPPPPPAPSSTGQVVQVAPAIAPPPAAPPVQAQPSEAELRLQEQLAKAEERNNLLLKSMTPRLQAAAATVDGTLQEALEKLGVLQVPGTPAPAAPAPPQDPYQTIIGHLPAEARGKMNEFRETVPEGADALEAVLRALAPTLVAAQDMTTERDRQAKEREALQAHGKPLFVLHPDTPDVVSSPAFQSWMDAQNPGYRSFIQSAIYTNPLGHDILDAIGILDEFKTHFAAGRQTPAPPAPAPAPQPPPTPAAPQYAAPSPALMAPPVVPSTPIPAANAQQLQPPTRERLAEINRLSRDRAYMSIPENRDRIMRELDLAFDAGMGRAG